MRRRDFGAAPGRITFGGAAAGVAAGAAAAAQFRITLAERAAVGGGGQTQHAQRLAILPG